jgi:two-component system LytT family sensor kinase
MLYCGPPAKEGHSNQSITFAINQKINNLAFTKRYSFRKVSLFTLVIYTGLVFLQFVAIMLIPGDRKQLDRMFTWHSLLSHCISIAFMFLFYYFNVNYYYRLIVEKRNFRRYIVPAVTGLLAYSLYYLVTFINNTRFREANVTISLMAFSIFISFLVMTALAILAAYLTSLRDEQKQRKQLEQQKMQLEVENSQANLNFLKAQINPHFLHNTLNFLYAKSLPYSAELSEGILCLSDIMRYALNEGSKDGKSLLKDEIEHLQNVIRINQFRFSNNLNVQFEVIGEVGGTTIVPFVLITLVENAFKHGDLKNLDCPIVIRVEISDGRLYFYCHNKKNTGFKEISTGIGLQNIQKRLTFAYADRYTYQVKDETDFYTTELTIHTL